MYTTIKKKSSGFSRERKERETTKEAGARKRERG